MKLKECSAYKLKRISKRKKIICFGAGGHIHYIFSSVCDMHIEDNIAFIVDNDSSKWGLKREINGKEFEIKSPDILRTINIDEFVILITTLKYNEVFAQIQDLTGNPNTYCIGTIKYRYQITFWLERFIQILPMRNSIVFQGEGDTCENSVALAKYLKENGYLKKYKIYWLCNNPNWFENSKREKYINRHIKLEKASIKDLIAYLDGLHRSKYLIYENGMIKKERDEQISIYLNHGSPPIKATKGIIELPTDLNYAVCPSKNCADILSEQYGINKERLLYCGSPRTDILFRPELNESLIKLLNISKYKKVILWVPTFRQHCNNVRIDSDKQYQCGLPVVESIEDWENIINCLNKNRILLIIKPHLLQKLDLLKIPHNENIYFITQSLLTENNANVYDLMKLCDGMITDYSTIAFDFMLLNRPIGYTIDDMKEYRIGFSVENPLDYMPGEKIITLEDFVQYLEMVCSEKDTYMNERMHVNEFIHGAYIDGENSHRLVQLINL